ncbi:heptaprenyl diphosphate synthase component 1 [Staphylococcus durrellii]|uniref:heptaprenyl diphosphate synthase component 1 n=1 Tax=Staphylococcus durrellii TaxID=2781773 RepID=UPI00189E83AF|nr:heptaprenyl diphosphate synthase component 1 [Staphylococcus durrellii]MBF7017081.1 heptaprenyl diphosphate synthase component 1 [Staphylococcus durrellii]
METTYRILENQITQRLIGINKYEPIQINQVLSQYLDSYPLPTKAKLACLTIDTAMRHLDTTSANNLSRHSILIGDLLSAHFYTLLAELNEPSFQDKISKAIVSINELKSSIKHQELTTDELVDAIVKIETILPYITVDYFTIEVSIPGIIKQFIPSIVEKTPIYLQNFSHDMLTELQSKINAHYI